VAVADEIDAQATRTRTDLDDLFNFGAHKLKYDRPTTWLKLVDDIAAAAKRRLSKSPSP